MCPASRAKRIPVVKDQPRRETCFLGGSVPFRFALTLPPVGSVAVVQPNDPGSQRPPASLHVRVGLGRPVTASLTTGLNFPWRALHVNKPQSPLSFAPLSSVQCPQPAHFVSARPTTSTSAAAISTSTARPSSSPSPKVARHPTDLPFHNLARPRRRPITSRCDDSHFHHVGGRRFSISPLRVQPSPLLVVLLRGCAPTAPSHRCSLHIAAAPTPNLHQQLARLHQAPPAHRAILPPPSRLSSTTRPPIGPSSSIREPRENNPAAVDSAVARRTSPLLHEACLLRRPDHHSSSPRCICSLHLRPASPAHGVLSCAVLTCRGFSLATARLRTETGDPFLSTLVAASTDLILGRLHFYRTPSGHCFFCAPASRKSRLALLQPVSASRSCFPPRCVSSVWPAYEESRRSHFSCLQILSHLMSP